MTETIFSGQKAIQLRIKTKVKGFCKFGNIFKLLNNLWVKGEAKSYVPKL